MTAEEANAGSPRQIHRSRYEKEPRRPVVGGARSRDRLPELRSALTAVLGESYRAELIGIQAVRISLPDADWALRFSSSGRGTVRWQVTMREPTPGLGTWWSSGRFELHDDRRATDQLAVNVAELTARFRRVLRDRDKYGEAISPSDRTSIDNVSNGDQLE